MHKLGFSLKVDMNHEAGGYYPDVNQSLSAS